MAANVESAVVAGPCAVSMAITHPTRLRHRRRLNKVSVGRILGASRVHDNILALATSCLPLVISQEEHDLSPYTAQAAIAVPLIPYTGWHFLPLLSINRQQETTTVTDENVSNRTRGLPTV